MRLLGNAGTVQVRLDGDRVTVAGEDGARREWRDVIALSEENRQRKVLAVGDTEEELRRGSSAGEQRALDRVRFVRALAPQGFDHEVAHAYLAYLLLASRRASRGFFRKPRLEIELPGYSAVPQARQLAFEDAMRRHGSPTLVNGAPARPLSPRLERASKAAALLLGAAVLAFAMASRDPPRGLGWLTGALASLALAALVAWWQERARKRILREAVAARGSGDR